MKNKINNELFALYESSGVYETLSWRQLFILIYWSYFNKAKSKAFIDNLKKGQWPYFAFKNAKKLNNESSNRMS